MRVGLGIVAVVCVLGCGDDAPAEGGTTGGTEGPTAPATSAPPVTTASQTSSESTDGGSTTTEGSGESSGGEADCPGAENPRGWMSETEVAIDPGIVRGELVEGYGEYGVTRFRGIPFAESTALENRFRPPVPRRCLVESADEVFEADAWPEICRQTDADGAVLGSEDCLGLNIWAPTGSAAGDQQPVLVWLHGGGMWYGNAQTDGLPGPHLASFGMVSVSLHSRVGPLGYVAHPVFEDESPTGEASGNYGIMDVIEGLRWVQDNIDAFGGDPDNVTVIGVSGGGDRVYYLMASPEAEGLFHRAAPHAGSTWVVDEPQRVERAANELVDHVGCDGKAGGDLKDCLRSVPVEAFDAFPFLSEEGFFYANADGYILPDRLEHVFASGEFNHVPMLSLSDAEDRGVFVPPNIADLVGDLDGSGSTGDEGDWFAFLDASYGTHAPALRAAYPFSAFASSHLAGLYGTFWAAAQAHDTDWFFNCAHRRLADIVADAQDEPVYVGWFEDCPDSGALPSTCTNGAGHGQDLALIFLYAWSNADELTLAEHMAAYWAYFASTGDPNGDELTAWPEYTRAEPWMMRFDSDIAGVDDHALPVGVFEQPEQLALPRCDVWDQIWDERGMVGGYYHDLDADGVIDRADNCITVPNSGQDPGACR